MPPLRGAPVSIMETPEGLLARLLALGIAVETVTHPPVFTVAESRALRPAMPGGHSKNLFLKPAKAPGPFLLAVLEEGRRVSANVWIPTMSAACSEAKSATYSEFMSAGHSD